MHICVTIHIAVLFCYRYILSRRAQQAEATPPPKTRQDLLSDIMRTFDFASLFLSSFSNGLRLVKTKSYWYKIAYFRHVGKYQNIDI